jgi:hypothetical protein
MAECTNGIRIARCSSSRVLHPTLLFDVPYGAGQPHGCREGGEEQRGRRRALSRSDGGVRWGGGELDQDGRTEKEARLRMGIKHAS